jgi:hypothetical protein
MEFHRDKCALSKGAIAWNENQVDVWVRQFFGEVSYGAK